MENTKIKFKKLISKQLNINNKYYLDLIYLFKCKQMDKKTWLLDNIKENVFFLIIFRLFKTK